MFLILYFLRRDEIKIVPCKSIIPNYHQSLFIYIFNYLIAYLFQFKNNLIYLSLNYLIN